MARAVALTLATSSITAQHKCQQCALNVVTAPRTAATLAAASRATLSLSFALRPTQTRTAASQVFVIHDGRAPPILLFL